MSIQTTAEIEERKKKLEELRQFHMQTLKDMGVHTSSFIAKLAYIPTGKTEQYIALFPSELGKGTDLFMEFAHRDNTPVDMKERTLYRLKHNQFYTEEYEKTEPDSKGGIRYLVPISELNIVRKYNEETKEESQEEMSFQLPDNETDLPFDQLTIRDFAAIMTRKPISHKEWLNKLIQ